MQKHLLDDMPGGAQQAVNGYSGAEPGLAGASMAGASALETVPSGRSGLLDGEDPPFDVEAT